MSNEPDEFDGYNLSDFTEDDFLAFDAHISKSSTPSKSNPTVNAAAHRRVGIQYESSQQGVASTSQTPPGIVSATPEEQDRMSVDDPSPFEQFRLNGVLSVTDFVAPAWCELKFDYDLRQQRSRRLENKPSSISPQGKDISVQQEIYKNASAKNGKAIHKKLEQEIITELVQFDIKTQEDLWGLRWFNTIWSLRHLNSLGFTRNLGVYGIIHGHIVTGIIDEVKRIPIIETTSPRRQQTKSPHLTHQCLLSIIDAKSRGSNTLPSHENTISSRLQLMLYHMLLSNMIPQSSPFPFSLFWDKLDLDPTKPFSSSFLDQLQLLKEDYAFVTCLNDLSAMWSRSVVDLNAAGVDPKLKLVYRMQTDDRKSKPQTRADIIAALIANYDAADVVRIQRGGSETALEAAIQQSLLEAAATANTTPEQAGLPAPPVPIEEDVAVDAKIIGTIEFHINDAFLDKHLTKILQYWHGEREAVGVDVQNARRCSTCEYRDDCEWREKKAQEAEAKARARRLERTTTVSRT